MQVLLNCLLANLNGLYKKQPNDNLITLACAIALVYSSYVASYIASYNMGKAVSTWPQLNINPCSYQLF